MDGGGQVVVAPFIDRWLLWEQVVVLVGRLRLSTGQCIHFAEKS